MKRILTVQDLSCLGKCSLTVALPVISAMGVEAAVLPTAVLSTHTAFPSPAVTDLTLPMAAICDHWQQIGATFDGICTGYLGSPEQADQVLKLTKQLDCGLLVVDPVMGDQGKLYSRITPDFSAKMRQLCSKADLVLPNLTEACFLTDTPYPETYDPDFVGMLLRKLTNLGAEIAIITGISFEEGTTGAMGYEKATGERYHYRHEKLPSSYHGTGDIFCAVCTGALVRGQTWQEALRLAADFTLRTIRLTMDADRDKRFGVCFEKALPALWEFGKVQ